MIIIKILPNENGSRPPLQTWDGDTPPEGYASINCDTDVYYESNSFVNVEIIDGVCVGMTCNSEARQAWLDSLPPNTEQPQVESLEEIVNRHENEIEQIVTGLEGLANG